MRKKSEKKHKIKKKNKIFQDEEFWFRPPQPTA